MTQQFESMLYLFGAAEHGATTVLKADTLKLHIEEIRNHALAQGIWTMVFSELGEYCDVSLFKTEITSGVTKSMVEKEFTFGILKKLEEQGVRCCILKGAVVAECYKHPELRISSDTDILIDPKDEEKVKEFLRANGYVVEERLPNHHHLGARHPFGGLLEVHVMLYSEITQKVVFDNLNMYGEPWEQVSIGGETYHTLGVNDNLMYLTAHYIKHLVNSGGGVRQMMDLLLFIEKNKEKIDFEKYEKLLKQLKYDKLIDVVKAIGAKYFGFDYEIKEEALMEKVLTDTEEGGIFGKETDTRKMFYDAYCEERSVMSKYSTKIYMAVKKESGSISWWLPKQETLIKAYGFRYAKCKLLIPVAWVHRYLRVLWRKWMARNKPKRTPEQEERLTLMRELGMIE